MKKAATLENYRVPRGALLGIHNAKTVKGEALGFLTAILYLAPHTLAHTKSVCPASTPDCRADCLFSSGRGALPTTRDARTRRTLLYWNDRAQFMAKLSAEIHGYTVLAAEHGLKLAVRLNGTSDILWERVPAPCGVQRSKNNVLEQYPQVSFYDYTKHKPSARRVLPPNYRLTFSAQRETMRDAMAALASGWNVSAVVDDETHAALMAENHPALVDGTVHDLRFIEGPQTIALLKPKGSLRKKTPHTSGMILTALEIIRLADWGAQSWESTNAQTSTRANNAPRSKAAPIGGAHYAG